MSNRGWGLVVLAAMVTGCGGRELATDEPTPDADAGTDARPEACDYMPPCYCGLIRSPQCPPDGGVGVH